MADDYQADLGQYLRRRNIFDPKFPVVNDVPEMPASPQPQNSPGPGPAMSAYQQALAQKAPSMQDYHPGKLRSVLAAIAGGGTGMAEGAKAGIQAGEAIRNAPFARQQSAYQENLKRLGAGAEAEVASGKEAREVADETRKGRLTEAQIGEYGSLSKEREARAKLEERKAELEGQAKPPKVMTPFHDPNRGMLVTPNEDPTKPPTVQQYADPKETKEKIPSLSDLEIQKLAEPYGGDVKKIPLRDLQNAKRSQDMADAETKRRSDAVLQKRFGQYYSHHQSEFRKAADNLRNISTQQALMRNADPKSLALMAPAILKDVLTADTGSNIRITAAEINGLTSARGLKEGVEAWLNKIQGRGQFSDTEKQQFDRILSELQILYQKKLDAYFDGMEKLKGADNLKDLNDADADLNRAMSMTMSQDQKKPQIKLKLVKP